MTRRVKLRREERKSNHLKNKWLLSLTTTPPYRYTYSIGNSSSKARHEVMAQGRATVPVLIPVPTPV